MSDDLEVKSVRGALSGAAFGAGVGAGAGAIGGLIGSKDGQGASGAKRGALLGALTGGTTGAIGGGLMGGASKRINRQLLKDKPNMGSIDDALGDFKAAHGIGGIGSTLGAATVGGVGSALHTNKKGFDAYNEGFATKGFEVEEKGARGALIGGGIGALTGAGTGAIGGLVGAKDGKESAGAKVGAATGALVGATFGALAGSRLGKATSQQVKRSLDATGKTSQLFKKAGIDPEKEMIGTAILGGLGTTVASGGAGAFASRKSTGKGFDGSIEEKRYGANRIPKYLKKRKKPKVGKPMDIPV